MPAVSARGSSGNGYMVVVPPGKKVKMAVRGFCLYLGIPAPKKGEPFQLIKATQLIDPSILSIYKALQIWEAKHPDRHEAVQSLIWGIRHARSKSPVIRELADFQKQILNEAYPGGVKKYEKYLAKQYNKALMDELKLQALGQVGSIIDSKIPVKISSNLGLTSSEDLKKSVSNLMKTPVAEVLGNKLSPEEIFVSSNVSKIMSQLMSMPVNGSPQANTAYTLLDEGVAAYSYSPEGGVEKAHVEIVNTTNRSYSFNTTDYVGFSTRSTQPIAIHPDTDGLPKAPQEEKKDCEKVTILSVKPVTCCFKVGEEITPDHFIVETDPPNVPIVVSADLKPFASKPFGTQNVTITAECSNGYKQSRQVPVTVVNESYETSAGEGSVDLLGFKDMINMIGKVEKILDYIPHEGNHKQRVLSVNNTLRKSYRYLCCNESFSKCEVKKVEWLTSTYQVELGDEFRIRTPYPGVKILVGYSGDVSVNFSGNTAPTCYAPQQCADVTFNGTFKAGLALGFEFLGADITLNGSIYSKGLEICYPSTPKTQSAGKLCGRLDVALKVITPFNLFSYQHTWNLLDVCR